MNYGELNKQQIEEYEQKLITKADKFWIEMYGKREASDVDKVRLLSRQGKILSPLQNAVKRGYFRKQGLWIDGKTTFNERKKQLILKKTEFGKKIAQLRDSKIKNMDQIIEQVQKRKKALEKIPVQLQEEFKINKSEILTKLTKELNELYETSKQRIGIDINNIYDNFINATRSKQEQLIKRARNDLEVLQKQQKTRMVHEVEDFSSELEAELTVLNYAGSDIELIEKYNEEVRVINQELNELEQPIESEDLEDELVILPKTDDIIETPEETEGLNALTVVELKSIADSSNIEYNPRILKADLIELLKV